jgi:hypothetical protein
VQSSTSTLSRKAAMAAMAAPLSRPLRPPSNPLGYYRNNTVNSRDLIETAVKSGQVVKDIQSWVRHPVLRWMAATPDGVVEGTGAVFEAKFMLPWSFSEEEAAEKHMAQLQAQHVGHQRNRRGAVDYHRGRQVGRDQDTSRFALSAPPFDGGEEILALCGNWGAPSPLRCRATAGPH